jgi:hypothetical protein
VLDDDQGALSPDDVEAVLAAVDRITASLGPVDRETLSFNVLVNALGTVIERIRSTDPGLAPAYIAAAQAMLEDS